MSVKKGYVNDGLGNFILPKTFSDCIYDEDTNERLDNTLDEMKEDIDGKIDVSKIANNDIVTEAGFVWDARRGKQARQDIGTMSNLTTTEKGSLVGAVNEVNNNSKYFTFTLPTTITPNEWVSVFNFGGNGYSRFDNLFVQYSIVRNGDYLLYSPTEISYMRVTTNGYLQMVFTNESYAGYTMKILVISK